MNGRFYMVGVGLLVVVQAIVLFIFGQPAISESGTVELWHGAVLSEGNSQHLSDWYTFSHIIHGVIFYALIAYFFPKLSVWARLLIATGIEVAWEILENTPMIINHYREQALAQGYTGDSIINSVSDTCAMMFGFLIAHRFAAWSVLLFALFLELWVGYEIRDNLTLNIINLIYHFDFIAAWQSGA